MLNQSHKRLRNGLHAGSRHVTSDSIEFAGVHIINAQLPIPTRSHYLSALQICATTACYQMLSKLHRVQAHIFKIVSSAELVKVVAVADMFFSGASHRVPAS